MMEEDEVLKKRWLRSAEPVSKRRNHAPVDYSEVDEKAAEERSNKARHASLARKGIRNHPTTADIDYKPDEIEFINAMYQYIQKTGHKFPTHTETLHVLLSLGYTKTQPAQG